MLMDPSIRQQFVPQKGIYLLSHSVGLPPVSAKTYLSDHYFDPWVINTPDVWTDWLTCIEEYRQSLANVFDGQAANFCPQTNVSSALTKILYSLDRPKKTILLSEKAFPSLGFVFARAQSQDFHIKFIPNDKTITEVDVWDEYLTNDVGWVLVTHTHSETNERSPVKKIVDLAKSRGIVSIIDVCQSAGVVPINVQEWDADFVVGSCVKWLCGGPGAGFLWVHPKILGDCEPVDVGWFSHEAPFEFDIHSFRFAEDAWRFFGGTPSVMPFVVATNSINLIHKIGVPQILEHNQALSQILLENLPSNCDLITPKEPALRGGTVVLNFGENQEEVANQLKSANVYVDGRSAGLRFSPHIYNTADEMEQVIRLISLKN